MGDLLGLAPWRALVVLSPLLIVLVIASVTDVRERKIYNKLTYPAVLIGLVCRTIALGWEGLLSGAIGAGAMLAIGLVLIMTPIIRGGDIKLFIAVGAFLGGRGLFEVAFYSLFCGAALAIARSVVNGYIGELMRRMYLILRGYVLALLSGVKELKVSFEPDERSKMPYGVAILCGGICVACEHAWGTPGLLTWYLGAFGITI